MTIDERLAQLEQELREANAVLLIPIEKTWLEWADKLAAIRASLATGPSDEEIEAAWRKHIGSKRRDGEVIPAAWLSSFQAAVRDLLGRGEETSDGNPHT